MGNLRWALACVLSVPAAAGAAGFPSVMPGWDSCKWNDPLHQTPKYVVGRIIAHYPHTPNGLKAAARDIAKKYPGSKVIADKTGDKIDIPCVGVIDLVVAADGPDVGKAWAWQVVTDKCKACPDGKDHCDGSHISKSKMCGGAAAIPPGHDSGPPIPPPCVPPNGRAVAEQVLAREGMAERLKHLCRYGTDWTYLDAVVDALNQKDKHQRWGYWCRRGDCNDPSHDVIAFHCGNRTPSEGSPNAAGVDFVVASCYKPEDAATANPSIGWQEPFGNGGVSAWTTRGRW